MISWESIVWTVATKVNDISGKRRMESQLYLAADGKSMIFSGGWKVKDQLGKRESTAWIVAESQPK